MQAVFASKYGLCTGKTAFLVSKRTGSLLQLLVWSSLCALTRAAAIFA